MEIQKSCRMLWQKREDKGARLLRIYGASSHVTVPPRIAGRPCAEIAPYCFAPQARLPVEGDWEESALGGGEGLLKELCKDAVEEVALPESVRQIGDYAFYDCRNLKRLQIGTDLLEIGSGAFINTFSLHRINLCGGAGKKSGIRQILGQISSDLEVCFSRGGKIEAVLFYPEYSESYDEVAPAHLFSRSITGEGFRLRQCFLDGRADFEGYDAVFAKACETEAEETLSKMALCRLRHPFALGKDAKDAYLDYIKSHMESVSIWLVQNKDLDALHFLCKERLLGGAALFACIQETAKTGWAQGATELLRRNEEAGRPSKKSRYEF